MKEEEIKKEEDKFICINCSILVNNLFQPYENIQNTISLTCLNCNKILDIYLTLTFPNLLLDLLLFKSKLYKHLLFNKGGGNFKQRQQSRKNSLIKISLIILFLDSYIRCANVGYPNLKPFQVFGETFRYCLLETLSWHGCIKISALIFQFFSSNKLKTRNNISRLSLTLCYASIPTLFLLTISSLIFSSEYSIPLPSSSTYPSPPPSISPFFTPFLSLPLPLPLSFLTNLNFNTIPNSNEFNTLKNPMVKKVFEGIVGMSRGNLRSGVSKNGNVRGWASEAIVRKLIGCSTVVGISVLMDYSKKKTCCLLSLAWCLHLVVLHAIDPWVM